MTTGSTLLGDLLKAFTFVLSGGMARTLPEVLWLFSMLATLELIICGALWAFGHETVIANLIWKVVGLSTLFWIITEWQPLLKAVREGFIQAGLLAGGNVISVTDFTDPGNLIDFGMSVTAVIFQHTARMSILNNFWPIVGGGGVAWGVIIIYIVIATLIFMAILEFYLVGVCAMLLLPFLAFQKTAFVGERVFASIIAHGVRLMFLALVVDIVLPILFRFKLPAEPTLHDLVLLAASAIVLLTLAWNAHAIASGLISGMPMLHAGHALHTVTGAVEAAATLGTVGAGLSIAGAAGLRAGLGGASAMSTAARRGASQYRQNHGGGAYSTIVGGMRGMGQYLGNRTIQGFRDAVANGRARGRRYVP